MHEDYRTIGLAEEDQTIGQFPLASSVATPRQRAAAPVAQSLPALAMRAPVQFARSSVATSMPSAAITEDRVRQIVRDEIGARVPYGDIPPRPVDGEAMYPLGLGTATFVASGPTDAVLYAQPQRAFRGERLVLQIGKNGASAQPLIVLLTEFSVGDYRQFVGGGDVPASVFAADAFGVRLLLDGAAPGVLIRLGLRLTGGSLAGTDTVTVSGALIGRASDAPRR